MNHLERLCIADDTMGMFPSDHGDMLGEHGYPCEYRSRGYRAAMQVHFNLRYRRSVEGRQLIEGEIVVGIDTPVTLVDLALASPFTAAQAVRFRRLLDGSAVETREAVIYLTFRMDDGAQGERTPKPERGLRTGDWLYVRQPDRRKFLFDQRNDAREMEQSGRPFRLFGCHGCVRQAHRRPYGTHGRRLGSASGFPAARFPDP